MWVITLILYPHYMIKTETIERRLWRLFDRTISAKKSPKPWMFRSNFFLYPFIQILKIIPRTARMGVASTPVPTVRPFATPWIRDTSVSTWKLDMSKSFRFPSVTKEGRKSSYASFCHTSSILRAAKIIFSPIPKTLTSWMEFSLTGRIRRRKRIPNILTTMWIIGTILTSRLDKRTRVPIRTKSISMALKPTWKTTGNTVMSPSRITAS